MPSAQPSPTSSQMSSGAATVAGRPRPASISAWEGGPVGSGVGAGDGASAIYLRTNAPLPYLESGQPIPDARLEAVPTARYDAQCQALIESANGDDELPTL